LGGKITISSSYRFEGQSYICQITATIPVEALAGLPWLDITRLDGRRVYLSANPAGMIASYPLNVSEILKEYRGRLAGQSWRVRFSGPSIDDTNGLRSGTSASWDFSLIEILEGAPIKGTLASATVSY
jgi:hypothetical protein